MRFPLVYNSSRLCLEQLPEEVIEESVMALLFLSKQKKRLRVLVLPLLICFDVPRYMRATGAFDCAIGSIAAFNPQMSSGAIRQKVAGISGTVWNSVARKRQYRITT